MNQLEFHPATAEHWKDLEALFGERGAYGNCWCMWWHMKRSEFDKQSGRAKKQALKDIVDTNQVFDYVTTQHDLAATFEQLALGTISPAKVLVKYT